MKKKKKEKKKRGKGVEEIRPDQHEVWDLRLSPMNVLLLGLRRKEPFFDRERCLDSQNLIKGGEGSWLREMGVTFQQQKGI